ncbi:hypothetical protein [Stenomitos frigidus]|uniref:Uncharacterized protein n=1 Tax=Stenomitos frigidus ULC18 TaxID=2107698 RepID=A0A2T1DU40_9CYAN|nr:hypothetical protein [Stenomitos frigidus]PSB24026.1 hypothetical protein C7B82_28610 [Stenomitos frigidus ULC18]
MNVRELIEALSQFDPETRVVVAGYEEGFNDITQVQAEQIRLNAYRDWFYGSHAKADDERVRQSLPDAPEVMAIALTGKNQTTEGLDSSDLMNSGLGWRQAVSDEA